MPNFNQVIIVGHLTRDPEIRYTPKGVAVTQLSVAVNRNWKSDSGEAKEEVCFVDCTAWSHQAEVIAQFLKKGSPILVQGRLRQESWEDKNTKQKRTKLGVVVERFEFLGQNTEGAAPPRPVARAAAQPQPERDSEAPADDDIPF